MGALGLAQFARQRDGGEAALDEAGVEAADVVAGAREHQRRTGLEEAQAVDHRRLDIVRREPHRLIVDVGVRFARIGRRDPEGVALIAPRERLDRLGQCRREQQRPPLERGRIEDRLEIVAEAEVEHFVGLVEDDDPKAAGRERPALEVVAQPPRRTDDEVRAGGKRARLAAYLHAADAGRDRAAGVVEQPVELARDLESELAGRRDDEGERLGRRRQAKLVAEERRRQREAVGDGLARPRLGRDEQVAALRLGGKDGGLDRRRRVVAARGERRGKRGGSG